MKVLHITPSTIGYEVVELIANRVSRTNGLAVIEKDGEEFITGGYILEDCKTIRDILDKIPISEQYNFIKTFRSEPFEKSYYEE